MVNICPEKQAQCKPPAVKPKNASWKHPGDGEKMASHKPSGCHHGYLQGLKLQEASAQRSGFPTKVQHASSEVGVQRNVPIPGLGF